MKLEKLFAYKPTLSQAWILLLLACVCQLPGGVVGLVIKSIAGPGGESWGNFVGYIASFALLALIVVRMGKDQGGTNPPLSTGIKPTPLLLFLLFVLMPLVGIFIEPLTMFIPMPDFVKLAFEQMFGDKSVAVFLMAVVAAPICEEWLCRGVILNGLLKHVSPTKAVIHSALIFAILHLNPWQMIPAFCIGLLIGWVYYRTHSLGLCMFMHAVNNGIAFLMLYLFPDSGMDTSLYDITGNYYLPIYFGALMLAAVIGYFLYKTLHIKVQIL